MVAPADLQGSVVPEDPGVLVDLPLASMDPTGSGRQGLTDRHASMDLPNLVACALKCADAAEWNSVADRRASMARCVDVDEGEWTGSEEEWRVGLDVVEDLMVDSDVEEWTEDLEDEAAVGSMDLLDAVGSMDLLDAAGSMALQDAVALVALMAPPDVVGSMDLLDVVVLMDLLDVVGSMDHRDVVGSMDLPDGVGSVGAVGLMDLHPRQRRNLHFVPYQAGRTCPQTSCLKDLDSPLSRTPPRTEPMLGQRTDKKVPPRTDKMGPPRTDLMVPPKTWPITPPSRFYQLLTRTTVIGMLTEIGILPEMTMPVDVVAVALVTSTTAAAVEGSTAAAVEGSAEAGPGSATGTRAATTRILSTKRYRTHFRATLRPQS